MCTIQGVHCGAQLDIDSQGAPGDILGSWESSAMGRGHPKNQANNWDGQSKGRLGSVWLVIDCDEGISCCTGNILWYFILCPQAARDGTFSKNDAPSEMASARATVSREHLLDWSSTRRNLHCLRGTLPGPKGRDFHREKMEQDSGWMIIWHGGQLYLQLGLFF